MTYTCGGGEIEEPKECTCKDCGMPEDECNCGGEKK